MDATLQPVDLDALLVRFRAGDTEALAAVFDATAPGLFRTALHLAPDAAAAEDALQETFLALLEEAREGPRIRELGPWLAGTLRNKVLKGRRTERRVPDALRLEPRILEGTPPALAARAEEIERVHQALDDLPEPYREPAVLRWRYGMEPSAIAHARGIPPGTVRSLLSRAAEKLRASLGALASMLFLESPPRGLRSVREEILRRAGAAAPASAAAATAAFGGLLMTKKTMVALGITVAVIVLALGLIGWWFLRGRPESGNRVAASRIAAPSATPSTRPVIPTGQRSEIASSSKSPSPTSGRRVLVCNALTDLPIPDASVTFKTAVEISPVRTGPDGVAALPAVVETGMSVEASAAGYEPGASVLNADPTTAPLRIPLVPGLEAAKEAFLAAAKKREALLSCCRIRMWTMAWHGHGEGLFSVNRTIADLDAPRETWVRWSLTGPASGGIAQALDLVQSPDAAEVTPAIVDRFRDRRPQQIVVYDGKRQLLLHWYPGSGEPGSGSWSGSVSDTFDTFHRRGALVWSGLRLESEWLSSLVAPHSLRLLEPAGDGAWNWLFVSPAWKGKVWITRFRTVGGSQLLPVREAQSKLEEVDLEFALHRAAGAFDEIDSSETVTLVKEVTSTVSIRGVLLPESSSGDARFLGSDSRPTHRYWLQYEPRESGSWPEGHFDTSRSPKAIAESAAESR